MEQLNRLQCLVQLLRFVSPDWDQVACSRAAYGGNRYKADSEAGGAQDRRMEGGGEGGVQGLYV